MIIWGGKVTLNLGHPSGAAHLKWKKKKKEIFAFDLLTLTVTDKFIYPAAEALLCWYYSLLLGIPI